MGLPASPGQALRKIRESAGLNQEALARRLSVDQSHVSKVENGRCEVSLSAMLAWAKACGFELELSGQGTRIKVPTSSKRRARVVRRAANKPGELSQPARPAPNRRAYAR